MLEGEDREPKLNFLAAYPYLTKRLISTLEKEQDRVRLLLDSGGFTAWRAGTTIEVDDYCRFIEKLPFPPWRYFALDVVGDADATLKNYETMVARGFKPIPIFTRGSDPSLVDHYFKTSDVLGVGGLVGTIGNKGFVNGFMKLVAGRRVHLLGFTQLAFLKAHRPYMCDTSSWEGPTRYGQFRIYPGDGQTILHLHKRDFVKRPRAEVCDAIRSYGFEPEEFARLHGWHGGDSANRRISAQSAVRLSLDLQVNTGTLLFSAGTTDIAFGLLLRGFERERERGGAR